MSGFVAPNGGATTQALIAEAVTMLDRNTNPREAVLCIIGKRIAEVRIFKAKVFIFTARHNIEGSKLRFSTWLILDIQKSEGHAVLY